ncbi:MAG: hypothetical protein A2V67_19520 [Deltaproteobacteria bacterium RBG_13_61_14]|nr:MAG: hypothetical protein A2V67_19520 [Deltaproteobacteria bacterium RBG_13_61_14]
MKIKMNKNMFPRIPIIIIILLTIIIFYKPNYEKYIMIFFAILFVIAMIFYRKYLYNMIINLPASFILWIIAAIFIPLLWYFIIYLLKNTKYLQYIVAFAVIISFIITMLGIPIILKLLKRTNIRK